MILVLISFKKFINTVILFSFLTTFCYAQDTQEIQIANEYFSRGEKIKALESYQALVKNSLNILLVHANYFGLLLSTERYREAQNYLEKIVKKDGKFSYHCISNRERCQKAINISDRFSRRMRMTFIK